MWIDARGKIPKNEHSSGFAFLKIIYYWLLEKIKLSRIIYSIKKYCLKYFQK